MPLIDAQLKDVLVCPSPHHAPLVEDEGAGVLRCTECHLAFPVVDGIPVMLLEEATAPTGENGAAPADADNDAHNA